jgi:type I restriction-modification system DNA methylase subunit
MDLELSNSRAGQFFTPYSVAKLMAEMTHGESLKNIDKPFITLSDPAAGAGAIIIAFVETMHHRRINPQERLWVSAWDIDSMVAHMCFIQLSLLHIPAEIVIGNSLSLEVNQIWRTPAHHLGYRDTKLLLAGSAYPNLLK